MKNLEKMNEATIELSNDEVKNALKIAYQKAVSLIGENDAVHEGEPCQAAGIGWEA